MNINVSTAAARRWGRPIALCPPLSRAWRRFYVPLRGAVLEPAQESGVLSIGAERRFFCLRGSEVIEHVVTLSRPDYSAENDDVTYDIEYVDATGPADTETCMSEVSMFIDGKFIEQPYQQLIHFS